VRLARELVDLQHVVEHRARERLSRGRFDVAVRLDAAGVFTGNVVDRDRAKAVYAELCALRDEIAPKQDVPFSMIAHAPDVFVSPLAHRWEVLREAFATAFDRAVVALDEMRQAEGVALGRDLLGRLEAVAALCVRIRHDSEGMVEGHRRRLSERAERLKATLDLAVDEGRLEQEIALFADRVDVAEELTRLDCHVEQLRSLAAAEGVGRKLDFLLQEMAREANTIGSKSPDAHVAHLVVDLKAEISRMREQVQNVE
jgi:uncharacterized protein (TIGR00255 family)